MCAEVARTTTRVSIGLAAVLIFGAGLVSGQVTKLVSQTTAGSAPSGPSEAWGTLSEDARFVAFFSRAGDIADADNNDVSDVFLHDLANGTIELISVSALTPEQSANGASSWPSISDDARFVVFESAATDLVSPLGDANGVSDVFLRDRSAGLTTRISNTPAGSAGSGSSRQAAISADGRFIAFASDADDLVAGDTNEQTDIFVLERATGTLRRVNLGPGGVEANGPSSYPRISADGAFVVYRSEANNLIPEDRNGVLDVFISSVFGDSTERISALGDGSDANGPSGGRSAGYAVSADARFVAFESDATNLVPDDENGQTDVFLRDRALGDVMRVSLGLGGTETTAPSSRPWLSSSGRFVAYQSSAGNIVPGDTNGIDDVFVYDAEFARTIRASLSTSGLESVGDSVRPVLPATGTALAFVAHADDLVPDDGNSQRDVLIRGPIEEIEGLEHAKRDGHHSLRWLRSRAASSTYDVYRGRLAALQSGDYDHDVIDGACGLNAPEATLSDLADGVSAYYLVAMTNFLGRGPLGSDSSGVPRPAPLTACP